LLYVYGDLHIHIGSAQGRPVKITASNKLDLWSIIFDYAPKKGLDMIGIVDSGCTGVTEEIEELLIKGELQEHSRGGFTAANGVLLITGCEVESREGIHSIIYIPTFQGLKRFQRYMQTRVKNMRLSTQKANVSFVDLINLSHVLDGIFCPAHVFTPHKGAYGAWTAQLAERIGREIDQIKVIELGLSADTDMAGLIAETRNFSFLSNSDAHSPPNIGREYNLFRMQDKNFEELKNCIDHRAGRRIIANYGMDPLLGKYHRSFCPRCSTIAQDSSPTFTCSNCGNENIVMGVYDRIMAIKDYAEPHQPVGRPPYYYRVPLKDLPGIGPKTYNKLLNAFYDEISVIEKAEIDKIEKIAGSGISLIIKNMRSNRLNIIPGGGGYYGKVQKINNQ